MLIKRARRPTRFPERKVRLVLSEWWEEKTSSSVRPRRDPEAIRRTGGTVFDILPAVSAAQAIPALDKVESLLRFAAGIHVIQRNGYVPLSATSYDQLAVKCLPGTPAILVIDERKFCASSGRCYSECCAMRSRVARKSEWDNLVLLVR